MFPWSNRTTSTPQCDQSSSGDENNESSALDTVDDVGDEKGADLQQMGFSDAQLVRYRKARLAEWREVASAFTTTADVSESAMSEIRDTFERQVKTLSRAQQQLHEDGEAANDREALLLDHALLAAIGTHAHRPTHQQAMVRADIDLNAAYEECPRLRLLEPTVAKAVLFVNCVADLHALQRRHRVLSSMFGEDSFDELLMLSPEAMPGLVCGRGGQHDAHAEVVTGVCAHGGLAGDGETTVLMLDAPLPVALDWGRARWLQRLCDAVTDTMSRQIHATYLAFNSSKDEAMLAELLMRPQAPLARVDNGAGSSGGAHTGGEDKGFGGSDIGGDDSSNRPPLPLQLVLTAYQAHLTRQIDAAFASFFEGKDPTLEYADEHLRRLIHHIGARELPALTRLYQRSHNVSKRASARASTAKLAVYTTHAKVLPRLMRGPAPERVALWQERLLRYVFRKSSPRARGDHDKLFVCCGSSEIDYGYSFARDSLRLVFTLVTENAYAKAVHAKAQGKPLCFAGVPGTGKTETAKELCRTLGRPAFVFAGAKCGEGAAEEHAMAEALLRLVRAGLLCGAFVILDEATTMRTEHLKRAFVAAREVADDNQSSQGRLGMLVIAEGLSKPTAGEAGKAVVVSSHDLDALVASSQASDVIKQHVEARLVFPVPKTAELLFDMLFTTGFARVDDAVALVTAFCDAVDVGVAAFRKANTGDEDSFLCENLVCGPHLALRVARVSAARLQSQMACGAVRTNEDGCASAAEERNAILYGVAACSHLPTKQVTSAKISQPSAVSRAIELADVTAVDTALRVTLPPRPGEALMMGSLKEKPHAAVVVLLLRKADYRLNLRARDVLARCEVESELTPGTRYTVLRDAHRIVDLLPELLRLPRALRDKLLPQATVRALVQWHWKMCRPLWALEFGAFFVLGLAFFLWVVLVLDSTGGVHHTEAVAWLLSSVVFTLFLPFIAIEAVQRRALARQLMGRGGSVLGQLGDYCVFGLMSATLAYSFTRLAEVEVADTTLATLASLTLVAYFAKFFSYLRALEAFGFLVTMLTDIAWRLRPFAFLVALTLLCFSMCFFALQIDSTAERVWTSVFSTYTLSILGDFDSDSFTGSTVLVIAFLLVTIVVTIVMLNVLISVVSDGFAVVQARQIEESLHQRATKVVELQATYLQHCIRRETLLGNTMHLIEYPRWLARWAPAREQAAGAGARDNQFMIASQSLNDGVEAEEEGTRRAIQRLEGDVKALTALILQQQQA